LGNNVVRGVRLSDDRAKLLIECAYSRGVATDYRDIVA
jgi:hypothetical protein